MTPGQVDRHSGVERGAREALRVRSAIYPAARSPTERPVQAWHGSVRNDLSYLSIMSCCYKRTGVLLS